LSKILEVNPWCFVDVDLQEPHLEGSPALQPELKLRVWELKMQMGRWAWVNGPMVVSSISKPQDLTRKRC